MPTPFTRADYAKLPEGFPAQLVAGSLVKEPSPTYGHQIRSTRIHRRLVALVGEHRAIVSPVDVPLGEFDVYQPDVAVYRDRVPLDALPLDAAILPIAVFEVASPTSQRRDRGTKRRRYLDAGVEEVWLVDAGTRTVERHSRVGVVVGTGAERVDSEAIPGFALVPDEVFAE